MNASYPHREATTTVVGKLKLECPFYELALEVPECLSCNVKYSCVKDVVIAVVICVSVWKTDNRDESVY